MKGPRAISRYDRKRRSGKDKIPTEAIGTSYTDPTPSPGAGAAGAWLVAQWPPDEDEPVKYRLSNLPTDTPWHDLVRLGKIRWRIEHDYRELKTGLGLDHYEGRSWTGWNRHVTLVTAAHLLLTMLRLTSPQSSWGGLTLYKILRELQALLAIWTGHCPTCRQRLDLTS